MKIGILTLPLQRNYGGLIQNWALQQILMRCGYESETIALIQPNLKLVIIRCASLIKCIIRKYLFNCKNVYIYSILNPEYNPSYPIYADNEFVKHINQSKFLIANLNLKRYIRKHEFDALIVGSDQVWREEYSPNILSYFLDFLPKEGKIKRIAYATSFGKEQDYISAEKIPECRRLLGLFDAVSVRENEGFDIVKRDFGREQVEKVLDPTLLLTAEDYEKIIQPKDRHHKPYIASYILDKSEDKASILKQIADIKKLPIDEIDTEVKSGKMATMSQWLANFADADFVMTDSFHGTVFSIIFGKPFVAIANKERGLDRFISLLCELNLLDRLIFDINDFEANKEQLLSGIDYALIKNRLNTLRKNSIKFLDDALS